MLRKAILAGIGRVERDLGYDMTYVRDVVTADLTAFVRFSRLRGITEYRRELPVEVWHAVRLVAVLAEDCGPCTQLMVTLGERAGVSPEVFRAVLRRDDAALPEDVRLGVQFVRAALARVPEARELREQVVARWGPRALVTIAFSMLGARIYPTLKYVMGHGEVCSRVVVGGEAVSALPLRAAMGGASG